MADIAVLKQLLIVLTATLSIVFVFQKLRVPVILGFLVAGVIIGPDSLGLIHDVHEVELLAEIGVVLLLFTIGLEFSLSEFHTSRRYILWAGILQVVITTLVTLGSSLILGYSPEVGIFYGFLISLSSTVIVLKVYSDRREIDSLQGKLATGLLLFQDLCIVPMMLLLPVLGQSGDVSLLLIGWALLKAVLVLLLVVAAARTMLPWLLRQVAIVRNREIFLLFVIFICLGTAWLTSALGLSLALGAFIAGLLISESEYSHQIVAEILPLRDCFSGIFFISIGMLLNVHFLVENIAPALLNVLLIIGIKATVIFVIYWWLYRSLRLGIILGLSLAQVGEFSFILAAVGRDYGLLTETSGQTFLAASILTMIATPFLIQWVNGLAYGLEALVKAPGIKTSAGKENDDSVTGHVMVVGYGLNGQNLTQVLKEVGIPYRILEMNPDLISKARASGVTFGDGTQPDVLEHAGIHGARAMVVAISDPVATVHTIWQARSLRSDLFILVRTRYVSDIDQLYRMGASQVIPEEFETSVEIFARVLEEYHVPRNVIQLQVDLMRRERYRMLRGLKLEGKSLDQLSQYLAGTTTDTVLLLDGSPAIGQTLAGMEVRSRYGVTVIAVVRNGESIHNPPPDFLLWAGDVLVLLGSHQELDQAMRLLSPTPETSSNF
jgi:CPA2 family monovalent cation:H+ antiporter-2